MCTYKVEHKCTYFLSGSSICIRIKQAAKQSKLPSKASSQTKASNQVANQANNQAGNQADNLPSHLRFGRINIMLWDNNTFIFYHICSCNKI